MYHQQPNRVNEEVKSADRIYPNRMFLSPHLSRLFKEFQRQNGSPIKGSWVMSSKWTWVVIYRFLDHIYVSSI